MNGDISWDEAKPPAERSTPQERSKASEASPPSVSRPSPTSSPSSVHSRLSFLPQFSPATQMILNRLKNNPGNLSAALPASSLNVTNFERSTYEDTKRRLVQKMSVSSSLEMQHFGSKAISQISAKSINSNLELRAPVINSTTTAPIPMQGSGNPPPAAASSSRPAIATGSTKVALKKSNGKANGSKKRKRGRHHDDDSSNASELSDSDVDMKDGERLTMTTKSGRHVQKPMTFNPSQPNSQRRKHYGKRTAEQALCQVCTRGLSPEKNRVVFCDGCNMCWHQYCHRPQIDDVFISDEGKSWFCSTCRKEQDKFRSELRMGRFAGVSWADESAELKQKYLETCPHSHLVNMILYGVELHPDLPIFPAHKPPSLLTKQSAKGIFAGSSIDGLFLRAEAASLGHGIGEHGGLNYQRERNGNGSTSSKSAKGKAAIKAAADASAQDEESSSEDSIPAAWPSIGKGVLVKAEIKENDFDDHKDEEAFSVTEYSRSGKTIKENGKSINRK
ncbi:hypothetical protein F5Y15DRAFT_262771 [Xylariaceae sp. FL0016]|nr:hypothetical protein F5Y15DRAFT_262771 [Xylariaceae sp. FL0016]